VYGNEKSNRRTKGMSQENKGRILGIGKEWVRRNKRLRNGKKQKRGGKIGK
jgi:hypothetical protein